MLTKTSVRFYEYLMSKQFSDITVRHYMGDLRKFLEHLQSVCRNPIYATESDVRQVIYHYAMDHRLQTKTLVCILAVVKQFYRFLYRNKLIDTDPTVGIEYPKLKTSKIIPLTQEQIEQVVNASFKDRDRLIVELFHYTGIRRAELLNIRVCEIDFDRKQILINGKGNKQRYVPFNEKLHRMLKEYIGRHGISRNLIRIKERRIDCIFEEISRKVGFRVHPHMLRHAYASELYRKTKDVLLIKKLLGHSNIATTSRYLESLSALDDHDMESYRKVFG